MKVYASIPEEFSSQNVLDLWNHYEAKIHQEYPKAQVISNYTGQTLEEADLVIFLLEFKDLESCRRDMERCKASGIQYNFFAKFYAPDRYYYSN